MELKKLQKILEAINTYYAFALLVYVAVLYIASHSHLFFWAFFGATPLLAGWTGYILKSFLERRNQRHGFRMLSNVMTYEIADNRQYTLRYTTKLKACTDHLMVYPVGYQWSGNGKEAMPKLSGKGQQLLAVTEQPNHTSEGVKIAPYAFTSSTQGDWHYWFVAFNPPLHKGEVTELKYSQEFHDKKGAAKPCLYYFVRIPMKKLELNVKFPANALPKSVSGVYIKPSDPRRVYQSKGVCYDSEKQWATWTIDRPKKGYCYRIEWQ